MFASTNKTVDMSPTRCRRSFTRHERNSVRTAGVTSDGTAFQSGSSRTTAPSTSVMSSPSKARLPVSISYSTHPKPQMSLRLSASRPLACSGLI